MIYTSKLRLAGILSLDKCQDFRLGKKNRKEGLLLASSNVVHQNSVPVIPVTLKMIDQLTLFIPLPYFIFEW